MTATADRPTVVVRLTNDGNIEVIGADAPVRVIVVDYTISGADPEARLAPDGNPAVIYEKVYGEAPLWDAVSPDLTAQYEHALAAPTTAEDAPERDALLDSVTRDDDGFPDQPPGRLT